MRGFHHDLLLGPGLRGRGRVLNPAPFVFSFLLLLLVVLFMVWVLRGRSVPPQVDSDKLRNELHS